MGNYCKGVDRCAHLYSLYSSEISCVQDLQQTVESQVEKYAHVYNVD